jgi:hypothetical protein
LRQRTAKNGLDRCSPPAIYAEQGAIELVQNCISQEEIDLMNILEHNAGGATIQLDQRELLLVMALLQEGRESFGCNTDSGKALDQLFSSANVLVEEARRRNLKMTMKQQKISTVAAPEPDLQQDASNG